MISKVNKSLRFYAFYTTDGIGTALLTPTIDVYKNGVINVTAGITAEIGGGLYDYTLAVGANDVPGEYVGIFKTADAGVDNKELPALWTVGPVEDTAVAGRVEMDANSTQLADVNAAVLALNDLSLAELQTELALLNDLSLAELQTELALLNDLSLAELQTELALLDDLSLIELQTELALLNDLSLAELQTELALLNNLTTAEVKTQIVEALSVDTYAELVGVPFAIDTLANKLVYIAMLSRNLITQTVSGQIMYADDGVTPVASASVTDDGTTLRRNKYT